MRASRRTTGCALQSWPAAVSPQGQSQGAEKKTRADIMTTKPILIAGGGIGGLGAALGLARIGRQVHVLEQASQLGEIGAGIQIGPNAFHAFDALGVGPEARARAVYIDHLILMDAIADELITAIPLDEPFRTRFGNPYAVVHRGELHGVLLKACAGHPLVDLSTGAKVADYEQDEAGVVARLADGRRIAGAALIGADGLWSNVRKRIVGDGNPRVSGHTTYRSVIPRALMPEDLRWNAATLWAGPKCHIVHYPLTGGDLFNLVVTFHNDAPEPVAGKPVSREEVLAGFGHVTARARRIIEHGTDWKLWVLCDRDPVQTWVDGRAALLGDAAHPTLQYFAQGACMALEDGVCLAHMVESHDTIETALVAYNRQRAVRTARIQIGSRLIGDYIYHPAGALADMRNATMRAKSATDWYDQLQWLYGGTGLTTAI